ncbi:3-deoxy-D-manno-octulosonic acid transferase [Vibrio crassostreae]|nr:3-deoxy-D-manno-octulosonic acid transferase [Vibrio crassostreae]CAK2313407.1 3-deoxy-D-manno-octulosonic acid transferase [Vibrio crassostreae]CAK2451821.1 3-deoxy-D-manno-octulosonic acid transferase [Vibrio crassostreae]CAK2768824.1 3-deoxy-D-manno-octulosonic acid transferase [Vibrio crassostreae]
MAIRVIYTLLLALVAPFLLLSLYKNKPGKPKFGSRWKEHWGQTPKIEGVDPIWIHAVSVGESIAATPIIRELKALNPQREIVVTTTTSTGAAQIDKLGDLVTHRYMPIDFPWCISGFLKSVQPSKMLIIETELWPNTLHQVAKLGIPIIVINARLSERSCLRYRRFQHVFNLLSKNITALLCQYQSDADRFIRLGIQKERINVTGSIKFDIDVSQKTVNDGNSLRKQLGKDRPLWIAASTHKGEDEVILAAHQLILQKRPNALLVLVPRHPERFNDVESLCKNSGMNVTRRTSDKLYSNNTNVYLADTMGEMMTLISASDICFMGGSLLGDKVGGHNFIEPAALKKPCLTGPSYFNFSDIAQQLIQVDALQVIKSHDELSLHILGLIDSPAKSVQMGTNALSVVKQNQGALKKTIGMIEV